MPDLIAHLHRGMSEPFARPAMDCCMWPADWVLAATGIDPAAGLRGTYGTAHGALRIIRRFGGFEAMWRTRMAEASFAVTEAPRDGDAGVVVDAAGQTVAAIRVGNLWAAKSERGLVIEDFPMLAAWTILSRA